MSTLATGTIAGLARWPVKSLAGEAPAAIEITATGVAGDRVRSLVDRSRQPSPVLTAEHHPALLGWRAFHEGDALVVEGPDGRRYDWADDVLGEALSATIGVPVTRTEHGLGRHYARKTVLVTTEASRRALEAAIGAPVDLRRFRANLHLDLDAEPFAELGWAGAVIEAPDAAFEVVEPCRRCVVITNDPEDAAGPQWPGLLDHLVAEHRKRFGVLARVLRSGRVAAGDAVRVSATPRRPASRPSRGGGRTAPASRD